MRSGISEAEWRIMQLLWENNAPLTSSQIVNGLGEGRSPRTFKTHLQRLVSKGFVDYTVDETDSRVYHYAPKVSEEECIRKENKDFISLYYKGDVGGMLTRFIGENDLDEAQINELTELLNTKKEETL